MLDGDPAVQQAPISYGPSLDPFLLLDDRVGPSEVGIRGCHVAQALVVTLVVEALDEGLALSLEVAGQEVIFQQDLFLRRLKSTLDLALGLRM